MGVFINYKTERAEVIAICLYVTATVIFKVAHNILTYLWWMNQFNFVGLKFLY